MKEKIQEMKKSHDDEIAELRSELSLKSSELNDSLKELNDMTLQVSENNESMSSMTDMIRKLEAQLGEMEIGLGIINAFDKQAPLLYDAPDFSFDTRVHDPRGRLINLSVEINF